MANQDSDDGLGEIGGELDLEAVTRVATRVKRKTLELGLEELVPRRHRGGSVSAGASSLDADAFLGRKEKEASVRAAGGTPTLDRLGESPRKPTHTSSVTMDRELQIREQGMPSWGWVVILLLTFLLGFGGIFGYFIWSNHARSEAEAAALQASSRRLLDQERQRRAAPSPTQSPTPAATPTPQAPPH